MPPIPKRKFPPVPKIKSPPIPKQKAVVIPPKQGMTKPVNYRCSKCLAEHGYKPERCQRCKAKNSLVVIPEDECTACVGGGISSKGMKCVPCNGTGRRQPRRAL